VINAAFALRSDTVQQLIMASEAGGGAAAAAGRLPTPSPLTRPPQQHNTTLYQQLQLQGQGRPVGEYMQAAAR